MNETMLQETYKIDTIFELLDLVSVELDWAAHSAYSKNITNAMMVAKRHGVSASVTRGCHSGGGWPTVKFSGKRDKIFALVAEYDK